MASDIVYDCEFIERGPAYPVDLISVGFVGPDGAEMYLVSTEFDRRAVAGHEWLMGNVVPHLPYRAYPTQPGRSVLVPDDQHPDARTLMSRRHIADAVRQFVLGYDKPRLWAWYAAYDHVVLCQLFGTMIDLPPGFPMYTCDIKQEADRLGNPRLPELEGAVGHRAIDDAREAAMRLRWLRAIESPQ